MLGFLPKLIWLCVGLMALQAALPAHSEPYFVAVYGRTFKIDTAPMSREALKALPADIARGPGYKPGSEQVLAEVEERLWIARTQLEDAGGRTVSDSKRGEEADRSISQSSKLRVLIDRHTALEVLAGELRRYIGVPIRPSTPGHFTAPKLSPELVASYRDLGFDPLSAYYSFRILKAAFRSGDISLIARVVQYPLTISGKIRRILRNPEQLHSADEIILDSRLQKVAAKATFETLFVRDKGMMLGQGEVWLTHGKEGFGLREIHLE